MPASEILDSSNGSALAKANRGTDLIFKSKVDDFIETVFEKHKDPVSGGILESSLRPALKDLGILGISQENIQSLFSTLDANRNRCLEISEFRNVVEVPTDLERWLELLELPQLLARCIPLADDCLDPLRDLSRIESADVDVAASAFSDGLRILLSNSFAQLRQGFQEMEKQLEESKPAVTSKLKTFKMACGSIQDFVSGMKERTGSIISIIINFDARLARNSSMALVLSMTRFAQIHSIPCYCHWLISL